MLKMDLFMNLQMKLPMASAKTNELMKHFEKTSTSHLQAFVIIFVLLAKSQNIIIEHSLRK